MKSKTKENLLVVSLAAAGVYFLTRAKTDYEAGGFGGGGGIPLLPGDTEDAAKPDSIINYILPTIPEVPPMWDMEAPIVSKKATYAPSLIPTYPLEYYTSGGVSELSSFASQPQKLKSVMELQHYADPFAYAFSGRKEAAADVTSMVKKAPEKPVQFKDASIGGFFEFLYPITQLGKGARGRDIALKTSDVKSAVVSTKKIEARRATTSREYTRVATGGSGGGTYPSTSVYSTKSAYTNHDRATYSLRPKKRTSSAGQPD